MQQFDLSVNLTNTLMLNLCKVQFSNNIKKIWEQNKNFSTTCGLNEELCKHCYHVNNAHDVTKNDNQNVKNDNISVRTEASECLASINMIAKTRFVSSQF